MDWLAVYTLVLVLGNVLNYPSVNNLAAICPETLYQKTFLGYIPQGNLTAGSFKEVENAKSIRACIMQCCLIEQCNVVFMNYKKCFHITCNSDELCKPVRNPNPESSGHIFMVLVRPVDGETWHNVVASSQLGYQNLDNEIQTALNEDNLQDLLMEESTQDNYYDPSCTIGTDTCLPNQFCAQNAPKSRAGTCTCKEGYSRNVEGECVMGRSPASELMSEKILEVVTNRTVPVTRKHVSVAVANRQVKLPTDDVTLIANVTPSDDNEDEKYQYEWTSLQQPDGSTAVKDQNQGQLHLSKLVEGLYTFKVTVSNTGSYGETFVNVTVLPPSRINTPPLIIITPSNQTIKQPNTAAVLDASSSTDDDGIVSWHWELQQGPLGYQPQLKDMATLQLNDLTRPGNYTFRLTVTDTDKATTSKTANITVLKFIDYPPEANAGEGKIIYLPHNMITLNGNLSSDDHNITTWEWTKSPDDAQKAVDMQDTRTPYLQLSNLEEGMYTFSLKVTDSAGQSSTAQVHVFVKPPTNKPPVAEAGQNVTLSLPQTWVTLDATNSSDDNKIVAFKWQQVEGPSTVVFDNLTASMTNVTGLTKGTYIFKVSVTDDNNNVASDDVYVVVNQNINQKPKANAGDDFTVELPVNAVMINGSQSKDDWAIVKWRWVRDDRSLAMGYITEQTDQSPVLILTDVAVGVYIFNLTVFDEQGLSDSDSVTVTVKSDPRLFHLVEITIGVDANHLTQAQYDTLVGKLALLVAEGSHLKIRSVKPEPGSGNKARITFFVETNEGKPCPANDVVAHLREKLRVDASLLGFSVAKLQTTICQNNCSGHGVCNEQTRICACEAFWMRDMFKAYLLAEDSDCSWSILYVVLAVICVALTFVGALWGGVYLCCNWCGSKRGVAKPTTYKLIEDTDDLHVPPFVRSKSNLSDTDTDSDVVFESRLKSSRFESRNGGHKSSRNGFVKNGGRRVKT